MSLYAQFDADGNQSLLASNRGWSDLVRWTDDLPTEQFGQLIHLCEYGWCQHLPELESQLQTALDTHSPDDPTVTATAEHLLVILASRGDAEVIGVTAGFGPSLPTGSTSEKS